MEKRMVTTNALAYDVAALITTEKSFRVKTLTLVFIFLVSKFIYFLAKPPGPIF